LLGDAEKARTKLGWKPTITFEEMIAEMVQEDLSKVRQKVLLSDGGFNVSQPAE
jgi:GDPmannose 4,6-dehydratase